MRRQRESEEEWVGTGDNGWVKEGGEGEGGKGWGLFV